VLPVGVVVLARESVSTGASGAEVATAGGDVVEERPNGAVAMVVEG
jgi:hypothetical protein